MRALAEGGLEAPVHRSLALRRLCVKDQVSSYMWLPLLQASPRLETLILARNAGLWDAVLEESLGAKRLPELSQVR